MVLVGVDLTYVGRSDEAITLVRQAMRESFRYPAHTILALEDLAHYAYFRSCTRSEMTSSMNGLSLAPTLALGK